MQNTSNRKNLFSKLKWGDIQKITNLVGCSRSTVERWFDYQNDNEDIEAVVITFIKERESKRLERIEQAKKIA